MGHECSEKMSPDYRVSPRWSVPRYCLRVKGLDLGTV